MNSTDPDNSTLHDEDEFSVLPPPFYPFPRVSELEAIIKDTNTVKYSVQRDLSNLLKNGCYSYKMSSDLTLCDGHKYSTEKANGIRIQKRYTKMLINGESCVVQKASSLDCSGLSRTVVKLNNFYYMHYRLDPECVYKPPEDVKERLNSIDVGVIRQSLRHRSVPSAQEYLRGLGYSVSKRQLYNQQKHVDDSVRGKDGPRAVSDLSRLSSYASATKHSNFEMFNKAGSQHYRFMEVFNGNLQVFLHGCPSKEEFKSWQEKAEEIINYPETRRNEELRNLLTDHPTGVVFPCRVYTDTTFCLSDAYATIVFGELALFQNARSGKNTGVALGYMLHSEKSEENHAIFSKFLAKFVKEIDPKKQVPSVTCDGEKSLEKYSEELGAINLRCELHVSENFRNCGRSHYSRFRNLIFGYLKGTTWKQGVVSSYDTDEFARKLDKVKKKGLPALMLKWLDKNRNMLFQKCSAAQKLRAGNFIVHNTTNLIENHNKNIKLFVKKQIPAHVVASKFSIESTKTYQEFLMAVSGDSESLVFTERSVLRRLNEGDRQKRLSEMGLYSSMTMTWQLPPALRKCFDVVKVEDADRKSDDFSCRQLDNDLLLINSTTNRNKFITINRDEKHNSLQCTECAETLPQFLCCHLICALRALDVAKRTEELISISDRMKDLSLKKLTSVSKPKYAGRKVHQRKGRPNTAGNHIRTIRSVADVSGFCSDSSSEESSESEKDSEGSEDSEDSDAINQPISVNGLDQSHNPEDSRSTSLQEKKCDSNAKFDVSKSKSGQAQSQRSGKQLRRSTRNRAGAPDDKALNGTSTGMFGSDDDRNSENPSLNSPVPFSKNKRNLKNNRILERIKKDPILSAVAKNSRYSNDSSDSENYNSQTHISKKSPSSDCDDDNSEDTRMKEPLNLDDSLYTSYKKDQSKTNTEAEVQKIEKRELRRSTRKRTGTSEWKKQNESVTEDSSKSVAGPSSRHTRMSTRNSMKEENTTEINFSNFTVDSSDAENVVVTKKSKIRRSSTQPESPVY